MVAATLTLFAPSVALADKTADAERYFSEGLSAMKGERWQAACEAFAASNTAEPSAGTQINLGVCNEKQKKYATALTWFDAAARLADDTGREDRAKLARSEYERVAPHVYKVSVTIKDPVEGASIARDGEKLPAAVFVGKETPLDPGKHTFELSAKGKKTATREIIVPETPGKGSVDFGPLENGPPEPVAGGVGTPGEPGYQPPIVVNDGSGQRTVGIIVGGVGILGLLAAGGVQILANNEQSKSEEFNTKANDPVQAPDDKTRKEFQSASDSRHSAAKNDQLIAIITAAGGVVLLGVGIVLFFTAPSGKSSGKASIVPAVGPGYAGAALGLSF